MVKTVILAPDCQLSDEALMQENETIANPTGRKTKIDASPCKKETQIPDFVNSDLLLDPLLPIKANADRVCDHDQDRPKIGVELKESSE